MSMLTVQEHTPTLKTLLHHLNGHILMVGIVTPPTSLRINDHMDQCLLQSIDHHLPLPRPLPNDLDMIYGLMQTLTVSQTDILSKVHAVRHGLKQVIERSQVPTLSPRSLLIMPLPPLHRDRNYNEAIARFQEREVSQTLTRMTSSCVSRMIIHDESDANHKSQTRTGMMISLFQAYVADCLQPALVLPQRPSFTPLPPSSFRFTLPLRHYVS